MVELIWKATKFKWDEKCEDIFQQLKAFLSSPTVIQKPGPDHPIIIYLLVLKEAVSTILVEEVDKEKRSVYFVSQTLHATETRYQMIEEVTFVPVLMARRMRPYFQNHAIVVRIDYPKWRIVQIYHENRFTAGMI